MLVMPALVCGRVRLERSWSALRCWIGTFLLSSVMLVFRLEMIRLP